MAFDFRKLSMGALVAAADGSSLSALFRYNAGDSLAAATFTRASTATYKDIGGTRQTALANVARDGNYIAGVRTLLLEGQRTNHFLNSAAPATQTSASLGTGTYTLWMEGTGSIAVAGTTATITGAGTATNGSPVTFVVTVAGTVTYTVTGSPTLAQSEDGAFASSYIPTTGAAVTRSTDNLSFPWLPAPAAATWYIKYAEIGSGVAAGPNGAVMSIGDGATPEYDRLYPDTGSFFFRSTVLSGSIAGPALGDTMELAAHIAATGALSYDQSKNGGGVLSSTASGAAALAASFNTKTLYLANSFGSAPGFYAIQSVKIASGVQSLATMRGL